MYNRTTDFIEKNNILAEEQNGFRKNRCTTLAGFKLMKHKTVALFLDLSKAYDFVDHGILLEYELERIGIRGPAYEFFKNYLHQRQLITRVTKLVRESNTLVTFDSMMLINSQIIGLTGQRAIE